MKSSTSSDVIEGGKIRMNDEENKQVNNKISEFFYHLWRLCSQLENTLTSRTILPAALFSSNFDLPPAGDNPVQFNRSLQQIIAALGHLRPLNLDGKDKISFIKSFKAE